MEKEINYKVRVEGMQSHITHYNREETFDSYEAAVTYFQEMCDMVLDYLPEVTHEPANPIELSEGGIGHDYRVELEFVND